MTNAAEDNIKMAAGVAWRCQPPVLIIAPRGLAEGCERGKDASAEKYNAQDYFIFKGAYAARTARRGWKKSSLSLSRCCTGEVMLPPPLEIWTFEACF